MKQLKGHTQTKWWIAYTGNIVHYGIVEVGQKVSTGQSEFISFDNEEDWKKELQEKYNIDVEEDDVEHEK